MKGFAATSELAWHYTDATRLLPLLHTKALKPSLGIPYCDEKPVVWLTRANHFEPMALPLEYDESQKKKKLSSLQDLSAAANGLLRIGVAADSRLLTFQKWKASVDIQHQHQAEIMQNAAIELGSDPRKNWLISRKPIPLMRWEHIQIAFPEDVNDQGVQTWSEWDLKAGYTQELLERAKESLQCLDMDCRYCEPNQSLPTNNPLEGGVLSDFIQQ